MRVDKCTDEFLDRTGERQFLNLVFAAILIVLDVVGRQAQLGDMHVGRIFAIRRFQLVLVLFLAMPQHQIDGRIAGGEVLGIGLGLGMMQVEPGVGEEQIISGRDPAMGTQPLEPCVVDRWRTAARLRLQRHEVADHPAERLPDIV